MQATNNIDIEGMRIPKTKNRAQRVIAQHILHSSCQHKVSFDVMVKKKKLHQGI